MKGASKAVTRARADPAEVAARVNEIVIRMRAGLWVRGETAGELAEEWGLAQATVEGYAAEAWRRVCDQANDAEAARPTIAGTLSVALGQAATDRNYKGIAAIADTWSRVVGARAPERVEHAVIVAQYEAMPEVKKAAWLRERAARMLEEADRLDPPAPG